MFSAVKTLNRFYLQNKKRNFNSTYAFEYIFLFVANDKICRYY